MAKEIFYAEDTPYQPGYYTVKVHHGAFLLNSTTGSFNIIQARLLNLSYVQYLRFCRDVLGATIVGKNCTYPYACFKKGENLNALIRLLNARANEVLFEREHPDHKEHTDFVKQYKAQFKAVNKDVPHK